MCCCISFFLFPVCFTLLRLNTTSDKNSICGVSMISGFLKAFETFVQAETRIRLEQTGLFEALERAAGAAVATQLMNEPLIVKHE